jgi:hypothetical protein
MDNFLKLRAKHFEDTDFECSFDCAVAKAAREQFNTKEINTSCTYLHINETIFFKIEYDYSQFKADRITAESKNYSDSVIRDIELIRE